MKVVLLVEAQTAQLIGQGYGDKGQDIVFFRGTEQQCKDAANARRLTIDEMHRSKYIRDFEKTQFKVGDNVCFVSVSVDYEGFTIGEQRVFEMKESSGIGRLIVRNRSFCIEQDATKTVGMMSVSSSCVSSTTGKFACSASHASDVEKMHQNIYAWLEQWYKNQLGELSKQHNMASLQLKQVKLAML